jgi:uncharacterized membrane protein
METIIAVSFEDSNRPYDALTKLQELDQQGQVELYEARVVERGTTGELAVKESVRGRGDDVGMATASGGLIGLLVGVLAGPVGMLLGGSIGLTTGAVIDLDTDERDDSVLSSFVRHIQPGETSVLAHVNEQSDEVVDNAMAGLGGSVLRQGAAEVEAELAAAEEARRKAEHEARKELRQERQAQKKEEIDHKLNELKAKFRRSDKAASAS